MQGAEDADDLRDTGQLLELVPVGEQGETYMEALLAINEEYQYNNYF